jgi:L-ascorbate metabolism protein UlaG (beta-lactamase superfamily)
MRLSRRRLVTLLAAAGAAGLGGLGLRVAHARYYEGPLSDHFDGIRFFDEHGMAPKKPRDLMRWWASNGKSKWPPRVVNTFSDTPPERVEGSTWRVCFVGHATILLQTAGMNILLDPVWSERVSPVTFAGPRRVNDPGIVFDKLPPIDVVLLSHNHYDHLDLPTLARLAAAHPLRVVTPLGNDTILRAHIPGIRVDAFDWGDRVVLSPQIAVTLAPMRHWSARQVFDRNKALWAAFIIETPAGRIYHVADSGYGQGHHFRAARDSHGPFRLAILPIGAYEPRWFMNDQHMNPADTVQAFLDCGAEHALAHHYGTFQLTDEAIDEPPRALAVACEQTGIAPERFRVLAPGEVWKL